MNRPMFPGEKRSLHRFLAIYISTTLLLIVAGMAIFYHYAEHRIVDHQNAMLKFKTRQIVPMLYRLHRSLEPKLSYPEIPGIQTALYDIDRHYLIGQFRPRTIHWNRDFWQEGDRLYYRMSQQPYYLGAATIVASMPFDPGPLKALQLQMAIALVAAVIFVAAVGRWLGRLFLAPVHRSILLLDRFIKDTTHELNTPVSTILTNVELFKSLHPELEGSEELKRIEIASARLSRIYDDLAYLQLNHRRRRRPVSTDMAALAKERARYFQTLASRKGVTLKTEIATPFTLRIDGEDAAKLLDNLLSNAVKYTPPGGKIFLYLDTRELRVEDTGIGMSEEECRRATERFYRADEGEGGFGLGLNIVQEIVEYYGFRLSIETARGQGTKVTVRWEK